MPIYEYRCPRCNRIFSFLYATMSDEGPPTCPRCGAEDMERQLSLFSFVRGGTDPFSRMVEKADEGAAAEPEGGRPGKAVREPGIYRKSWDGSWAKRKTKGP